MADAKVAMRILVVEDDPTLAAFVAKGLHEAGYVVDVAAEGGRGLDLAVARRPDLAIVDVMLPGMDGFALVEAVRRRGLHVPVIILSAKRSVDDRVKGLQIGGDDYLTKPFAFAELLARVQALLRRAAAASEPAHLDIADLHIDLLSRRVTRAGVPIDLRPREFALLEYLGRHPGQVVSKTMILSRIWNYSFDPRTNVVDVLVCRLREKIDRDFEPKLLHTRRGMGYVLSPQSALEG
jgi:two-component system OmpR family response regulator